MARTEGVDGVNHLRAFPMNDSPLIGAARMTVAIAVSRIRMRQSFCNVPKRRDRPSFRTGKSPSL